VLHFFVRMSLEESTNNPSLCSLRSQPTSNPSGIAKLREASTTSDTPTSDAMNLDDFILPNSVASPAGISPSPRTPPAHTPASAIPIKPRKDAQAQFHPEFPPSAPTHDRMRNREFDYVQRRVRKTSIDETKVQLQIAYVEDLGC